MPDCSGADSLTIGAMRKCIQSLYARRLADSVANARDRELLDSLRVANRRLQSLVDDINRRLPPNGMSVAGFTESSPLRNDSTVGVVVNGDLILNGRLCIPDSCIGDAAEQIQIRSAKAAGILFQANRDRTWEQSPCSGISVLAMAPDLGLRLIQNQRWNTSGEHVDFICPGHAMGAAGFDSQAEWSFNGQKPGADPLGTQRLVIRTDEKNRAVYFATWAEGWRIEFRSSSEGCKWCENLRWKVPYQ